MNMHFNLDTVAAAILLYFALVLIVAGVGLSWSGVLLKQDNLLEGLVPYLRKIKSKFFRNLFQCHKCIAGEFALWFYVITWYWYNPPFTPLLLFLGVMWITSVIIAADLLYRKFKYDTFPGGPAAKTEEDVAPKHPFNNFLKGLFNKKEHLAKMGVDIKNVSYFIYNPEFKIVAEFIKKDTPETIELPTSTAEVREMRYIGDLIFRVGEQKGTLRAFGSLVPNGKTNVFIPFKDKAEDVNPHGRYLDVAITSEVVILDFNYAYNPYCAYSDQYSCPLVPAENVLDVAINAGEKAYNL